MSTEKIVLSNLIYTDEYARKVIPHLNSDYFHDQNERLLYETINYYWQEYNRAPSKVEIKLEVEKKKGLSEDAYTSSVAILDGLKANVVDNVEWLVDTTEKFCKDKAVYNAILKSIEIIDDKIGKYDTGAIPDILSNALGVCFDTHVGHDYLEDAEDRWEYYHTLEQQIPFDLELFNRITKGGVIKKSLNIVMMETGGGKSQFMCHCAAANMAMGYNVLYITLEMSEEKISERIDANLMNLDIGNIPGLNKEEFLNKFQKVRDKVKGKLIVKEYPEGQSHSGHFRYLLNELKLKKRFIPDVIYIDYLGICASMRLKKGNSNSYEYGKAIAEELRALSKEFKVAVWTAIQTNRGGLGNSDVDLTNTSESIGGPMTADLLFAMTETDDLVKLGQKLVIQLKNRYNDLNNPKRFVIGVDKAKMKFFDVENNAQDVDGGPVFDNTPSSNNFGDWS